MAGINPAMTDGSVLRLVLPRGIEPLTSPLPTAQAIVDSLMNCWMNFLWGDRAARISPCLRSSE